MTAYDFTGLTPAQQDLLTFGGWSLESVKFGRPQPGARTVAKLVERHLLTERTRLDRGMSVHEYDVPTPAHMAWCAECSRREAKRHARGK